MIEILNAKCMPEAGQQYSLFTEYNMLMMSEPETVYHPSSVEFRAIVFGKQNHIRKRKRVLFSSLGFSTKPEKNKTMML